MFKKTGKWHLRIYGTHKQLKYYTFSGNKNKKKMIWHKVKIGKKISKNRYEKQSCLNILKILIYK